MYFCIGFVVVCLHHHNPAATLTFLVRFGCDEDGWMLSVNTEAPYPHFFHLVPLANIALLKVSGDADISYVGFGPADLTPAPPVGFNLTFICPAGQVFDHDWFATPFLLMTCQVRGGPRNLNNYNYLNSGKWYF